MYNLLNAQIYVEDGYGENLVCFSLHFPSIKKAEEFMKKSLYDFLDKFSECTLRSVENNDETIIFKFVEEDEYYPYDVLEAFMDGEDFDEIFNIIYEPTGTIEQLLSNIDNGVVQARPAIVRQLNKMAERDGEKHEIIWILKDNEVVSLYSR